MNFGKNFSLFFCLLLINCAGENEISKRNLSSSAEASGEEKFFNIKIAVENQNENESGGALMLATSNMLTVKKINLKHRFTQTANIRN